METVQTELLKVGLIGTGGIAGLHVRGLRACDGTFEITAACDVAADRLTSFCREMEIEGRFTDYRAFIDRDDIDAVLVMAPHHLHQEICVAAFEHGKHVLVEKPIARTLEEADAIIAAGERAGRVLMVGHNQRYEEVHQGIHEQLENCAIGRIVCAHTDHHQNFRKSPDDWWYSKDSVGGGCVIGSGIHRLDLLRWYLGEPTDVVAQHVEARDRLEAEAAVMASIRFECGAIAGFFCNWALPHQEWVLPFGENLVLIGSEGTINATRREACLKRCIDGRDKIETIPIECRNHESMWSHFARCIATGAEPMTSGKEGKRSLALVRAIYRALDTGAPVWL